MLARQLERDHLSTRIERFDRELRDHPDVVLDLDRQVVFAKDALAQRDDLPEFARFQPVIDIRRHPHLQHARISLPGRPAAIDEVLTHSPDFRNMEVRRHRRAIGQRLREARVGVLFQRVNQFR